MITLTLLAFSFLQSHQINPHSSAETGPTVTLLTDGRVLVKADRNDNRRSEYSKRLLLVRLTFAARTYFGELPTSTTSQAQRVILSIEPSLRMAQQRCG